MRRRALLAVARKDISAISSNLQVLLPMLILPLILGIVLPGGLSWAILRFGEQSSELRDLFELLERIPASVLTGELAQFGTLREQALFFVMNYLLAPFFLLIPLMAASTVSADSFAGEKERGTLESLLFSPLRVDWLFSAKVLAALVPAVLLSWGTFVLTAVTVNGVAWPWLGRVFFPTLNWLPLMVLVVPLLSLAAILVNVFISARVRTFQAAYQLGGLVILPLLVLIVGNISGLMLFSTSLIIWLALGLALVDVVLLLVLSRNLDRAALFESQVR